MTEGMVRKGDVERAAVGESVFLPLANGKVMVLRLSGEKLRLTEAPSGVKLESYVTPGEEGGTSQPR